MRGTLKCGEFDILLLQLKFTVHTSGSLIMRVKGQEISEGDYGVFNFPKKNNEKISLVS